MNDHPGMTWGVSHLTDAPNVVVMGGLIVLLIVLARRHQRMHIQLWIVALALIFFDELIWLLPAAETSLRTLTHTTRLVGQLSAGICLLMYEAKPSPHFTTRQRFFLHAAPGLIALQFLYGLNAKAAHWYLLCAAAAIVLQWVLHRRDRTLDRYLASFSAIWVLVAVLAAFGDLRAATYSGSGFVFFFAARNAWRQLGNAYVGRIVVTTSLLLWTASFLVHPWVMMHPTWRDLAEQTWAMQKFIVTFGLVVVLFEEQSREHEHLSQHDNLTGLANRRRLQHILHAQIAAGSASVLLIDLDGFKQVNDIYGHAAGDLVLQTVARRLDALCETGDIIARVGGDEFIVASPKPLASRVQTFASAIAEEITLPGGLALVTGSLGLADYPEDAPEGNGADAVSTLLNVADLRMYTSKHQHLGASLAESSAALRPSRVA